MGRCKTKDCTKTAYYNYEGQKPKYCTDCKLPNMMCCIKKTTCIYKDCLKGRIYNINGQYPMYCKDHKKDDMINVKSPTCLEKDCPKRN